MLLLFRYLQLCHTLPEVLKIPGSKVVLTSWPDLECGFARDLFALWCSDARNSVVLTSRSGAGTLGRKLYDQPGLKQVTLELKQRVKLEGMELEEHRRRKEREKAIHGPTGQNDPMAVESSEDEDEGMRQKTGRQERIRHDIVVRSEDGKNNVSGVGASGGGGGTVQHFFKSSKKNPTMFPFFEEKIKFDEYGEIIRPEDYVIADTELMDHDAMDYSSEKPKWEDEEVFVTIDCCYPLTKI